jgi:hypothetical protein
LASIALTTDSSILTSLGNDYGYDYVFARQVEALCRPGDLLVGISTAGNSSNVCSAISKARDIGTYTFAMTGKERWSSGDVGGHLLTGSSIGYSPDPGESYSYGASALRIETQIDETGISDSD